MKKVLLLVFALTLGFGLKAQCPLTQAVDFTATDCHGTEVHLFDILDGGQYVLIDFFFASCQPCQQATPKVVESYYAFGCNMHDVFYMEISDRDSDAACQNWVNNYGVEYPTIGGPAGGATICNQYQIGAFPTVILIRPDHQIVIQDLWPINNAQTVISALEAQGVEQHDCTPAPTYDPQVTITVDQVTETEVTATFTPNEDCANYYYTIATDDEIQEWMALTGLELPEYLQNYGMPGSEVISNTFGYLEPNTEYTIYAVPSDIDGVLYEVVQESVTTGGTVVSDTIVDFSSTDLNGNEIHLYDILDAGQFVLINFFLVEDPFCMAPMHFITDSYTLFGCNENDVFFLGVSPNGHDSQCQAWVETYDVKFPIISKDSGGNDIAQAIPVGFYPTVMIINPDHTFYIRDLYPLESTQTIVNALEGAGAEQHDCTTSVEDNTAAFSIYPNPANDHVLLKGEIQGLVTIYNALGQQVAELMNEGQELRIPTTGYENGIYVVKVNGKTLRFVVTH